jgi:hypothetical protein
MANAPTTAIVIQTHRLPLKNWAINSMAAASLKTNALAERWLFPAPP